MSIAGLSMYDLPAMRPAVDAWWAGLARAFRAEGVDEVPDRLDRGLERAALWGADDLLLTQTCGYPLVFPYRGRLTLLATPSYAAPGAGRGRYRSFVVVREDWPGAGLDDLRGAVAAVNDVHSHSGMNAFRHLVAPLARDGRFFSRVVLSGGHPASLALLRRGEADVAAIDCVSHALYARYAPETIAGTRILAETASAPGLPYVTRAGAGADLVRRLKAGLRRAAADPGLAEVREQLLLEGFVETTLDDYAEIAAMEAGAAAAGLPRLV